MSADGSLATSAQQALLMGNILVALGVSAVGGFLTALSPCVYPIIPITVSIFGGQKTRSKAHAFLLAAAYTAGMVLLYAALGTVFASAGKVFGTLLANPWVVMAFALFCAAMAASMLGFFELSLPAGLQTRLAMIGGSSFRGAFVMGLVSGIIAAPCTGPVLSALLTYIATTRDAGLGFVLMLAYGLGMGLPFLALAAFSSALSKLPRSGAWMEWVKATLAIAMIALSLYYAQFAFPNIAPPESETLARWMPWFLITLGVGLGAVHLSVHGTPWHEKARKVSGAVFVGLGLFFAFGAVSRPMVTAVRWEHDYARGLVEAHAQHKPVMIDFFATWCAACVELDEKTFSVPSVAQALDRFVTIKVDGTVEGDAILALYKRYDVKGLPTVVFIDSNGETLATPRLTGFLEAEPFRGLLTSVR